MSTLDARSEDHGVNDAALPSPQLSRWQPLRAGLLNVFRFDRQEFVFERGRLLLRGNNGTGKTRALALTLPFLLDGRTHPAYVEPDGDSAKQMSWNLLLGQHDERVGYSWLELGRLDDEADGAARTVTIGCGLRAVKGRPGVETWFFITRRRIGLDLSLEKPGGAVHRRTELEEVLGGDGEVFTTAQDYRRAVDSKLFGLGERRYEALIKLLIALRKPQLSRQLDERALSNALSEALAPLADEVVEQIAEAFGDLESERAALAALARSKTETQRFSSTYGAYARAELQRRAAALRNEHSAYEREHRQQRDDETQCDEARGRLDGARQRQRQLDPQLAAAREAVRTLERSPEFRQAADLEERREAAEERTAEAAARSEDLREHAELERQAIERHAAALSGQETAAVALAEQDRAATAYSAAAGLQRLHQQVQPLGDTRIAELVRRCETRTLAVRELDRLGRRLAHAEERVQDERARTDEARGELEQARGELAVARREHAREKETLLQAVSAWLDQSPTLGIAEARGAALLAWLDPWCESLEGDDPLAALARESHRERRDAFVRRRTELGGEQAALLTERETLAQQHERISAGRHSGPPAPHWRDPVARDERPGAPLWALCDFKPHVSEAHRGRLEGALEAAGLLDAWIAPDGTVRSGAAPDSWFVTRRSNVGVQDDACIAHRGDELAVGETLAAVLEVAIDPEDPRARQVAPETVASVLSSIQIADLPAGGAPACTTPVIGADGTFALGSLHGVYGKPTPEHVGHAAREQTRRRELARLAAALDEVDAALTSCAQALSELAADDARLDAELAACPSTQRATEAARHIVGCESRVAERRGRLERAEERHRATERARDELRGARDERAAALELSERLDVLDEVERDIDTYRHALSRLVQALREATTAQQRLDERQEAMAAAAAATARVRERSEAAIKQAATARASYEALQASIGQAIEEVRAQLRAAIDNEHSLGDAVDQASTAAHHAELELARTTTRLETRAARVEEHRAAREHAIAAFRRVYDAGLAAEALVEIEAGPAGEAPSWAPRPAVERARQLDGRLGNVADDSEYQRRKSATVNALRQLESALLDQDLRPELQTIDDLIIVRVTHQGRPYGIAGLVRFLAQQAEDRERLLSAREREVIENHLIGEVAMQLHDRLRSAQELVATMNAELARRPTSTGMALRFRWSASDDAPEGFEPFRQRLMSTLDVWSAEDRQAVGAYLQRCIALESQANEAAPRREQLQRALDYRSWHQFVIERRQNDVWTSLTKRSHGTGSGGEKAIALTVPQFAAAAAHYQSARPTAPRLILLDEAFVGIDSEMRANCMGMLEAFDLDFLMTSEREWGCYAQLSGLSIYQLYTDPAVDAIGATRWTWNGKERIERFDAMSLPAESGRTITSPVATAQLRLDDLPATARTPASPDAAD